MANLGKTVLSQLEARGILVGDSLYGYEVAVTTKGLAWLLNAVNTSDRVGRVLTMDTLAAAARLAPTDGELRALRLVLSALPTHTHFDYRVLSSYLVGSPPKLLYHFPPATSLQEETTWPAIGNPVMQTRQNWRVQIHFTSEELAALKAGESVLVDICQGDRA